MSRMNKRRHERLPSSAPVALRWREESGEAQFLHGTLLDYSEQGVRIELPERVEFQSFVLVAPQGKIQKAWAGKIRYCLTRQTKYIVGVEFGQPADPQFSMLMFRP